jgi:phosphatidylglycerophosphate synthase
MPRYTVAAMDKKSKIKKIKKINLPNTLSTSRLLLTFIILYLLGQQWINWALGVFLLAALSDLLDGYLAKRWQQETAFGAWLDSLADNVLNIGLILYFYLIKEVPLYYLSLLLLRNGLQFLHSLRRFGHAPDWMKTTRKGFNRWEPGMVFFVLLFLFLKLLVGQEAGPVYLGIDQVILPFVFFPLSALTNLIISFRFITSRNV